MSKRFLLTSTPPRMIVSKQGFEASPELDDDNKCFDSNWFGGNGIKWVLRKEQQFEPQDDRGEMELRNMTIDFPYELNYQPACIAFHCKGAVRDNHDLIVVKQHYLIWNDNKSVTVRATYGEGSRGGDGLSTLIVVVFESRPTQVRTEKTTRIVIGANPYDGRKGLWVTEPGCRAGDLKEPHIISSDNDYLKLHATGIVEPDEHGSSHNKYWTADFYFPPLPYFPIVFLQLAANEANKRIIYPFDIGNAKMNGVEGSSDIPAYYYRIYKDHISLITYSRDDKEKFDLRVLVFQNKLV